MTGIRTARSTAKKSGNVSRILEKLQELRANDYSSNFANIFIQRYVTIIWLG